MSLEHDATVACRASTTCGEAAHAQVVAAAGTYLVGTDVQPGTYKAAPATSGNCYYERLSGLDGGFNSIISNDNSAGKLVVTVKSSDKALKVSGCAPFHKVGG